METYCTSYLSSYFLYQYGMTDTTLSVVLIDMKLPESADTDS